MGNDQTQTVVCVKQVKQDQLPEEWDESMPLPGDIIEGFAETDDSEEEMFVQAKSKSELSSQLGKIMQQVELIWVKVRRGENVVKLQTRIVQHKCSMLHRRFTIKAAKDDRHVAVLGDLTLEQCTKLQEMSRTVVNSNCREFNKRGVKYEWKVKVDKYLPDHRCTVVSSILFMPLQGERSVPATTTRCMAWFTAAISSGVPLVFVNAQTEQIILNSEKEKSTNVERKETIWGWQQNQTTSIQILQGTRLWFLPGVVEVSLQLIPKHGEERFGMDIKRTEEGFICVFSIIKGSAADRAGLRSLYQEACESGQLLVISRLEGKSVMPSNVCAAGLIHCCDHNEIRDTLTSAIDLMEKIQLHIMAWPNQTRPYSQASAAETLRPPSVSNGCCSPQPL
ncbi:PDZ domain containing protein [Parasponia andersonii]|uniref:PDZ domain containing protein n=1 Tax=Parasponia andersonii TaxID=3476 RepID=A0A2P5DEN6_PARAD|nr:PDZ domain containing protein [Parasponia andersonii]